MYDMQKKSFLNEKIQVFLLVHTGAGRRAAGEGDGGRLLQPSRPPWPHPPYRRVLGRRHRPRGG